MRRAIAALLAVTGAGAGPAVAQAVGTSPPGLAQALNPEIGVVGDVVGRLSELSPGPEEEDGGIDRFSFREAEVVFGAFVDPFARADFAFVFSDQGEEPEIEEAFITFFNLPWQLKGRAGKFRSKIGRVNLMDLNALPFVTEPEVIRRYFGEEGYARSGIQASRMIPAGPLFLEASAELLEGGRGEEGEVLAVASNRGEPTLVVHLRGFKDFSLSSNLEIGATWLRADDNRLLAAPAVPGGEPVPGERFRTSVYGVDVTWRWRKHRFRDLMLRAEGYRVNRNLAELRQAGIARASGFYAHGDMRFHPRWSAGLRYDRVEPLEFDPTARARERVEGGAAYLTYEQSEFARVRLQYQRTLEIDGLANDEFFLQVRFQIGIDRHGLQ